MLGGQGPLRRGARGHHIHAHAHGSEHETGGGGGWTARGGEGRARANTGRGGWGQAQAHTRWDSQGGVHGSSGGGGGAALLLRADDGVGAARATRASLGGCGSTCTSHAQASQASQEDTGVSEGGRPQGSRRRRESARSWHAPKPATALAPGAAAVGRRRMEGGDTNRLEPDPGAACRVCGESAQPHTTGAARDNNTPAATHVKGRGCKGRRFPPPTQGMHERTPQPDRTPSRPLRP